MRLLVTSGVVMPDGRKLGLHLLRDPRKRRARHAGGNGGHTRLVPADAGVDDAGAALRHRLAQFTTSSHVLPPGTRSIIDRR
jgi:hypothetical protein